MADNPCVKPLQLSRVALGVGLVYMSIGGVSLR
jgi:hypothetical protein